MHRTIFSIIVLTFVVNTYGIAQNLEWIVYDTSNSGLPSNTVPPIAIDGNGSKWIGTHDGLVSFDGTRWEMYNTSNSGLPANLVSSIAIEGNGTKWVGTVENGFASFEGSNWVGYDTSNSGLPSNQVHSIAIEGSGTKWVGTYDGLACFDGTIWTVYDTSNSDLPANSVLTIAIENSGIKWIVPVAFSMGGGVACGLVSFDGTNWVVYNTTNSGLPADIVRSIAIEENGTKWIGTYEGGLASFDGTTWTTYDTSNSGLPGTIVTSIAFDGDGTKWIGTHENGLSSYDGFTWTVYDISNSGLPSNQVHSIAIEGNGTKWIGTIAGLAVFNEFGIVKIDDEPCKVLLSGFSLNQNFPNPFNPTTTIGYSLPEQSKVVMTVFDIRGQEVMMLEDAEKPPGNYEVQWNGMDQSGNPVSTGVYFVRLQAGEFSQTIKMLYLK